jgi:hypothetical protein
MTALPWIDYTAIRQTKGSSDFPMPIDTTGSTSLYCPSILIIVLNIKEAINNAQFFIAGDRGHI